MVSLELLLKGKTGKEGTKSWSNGTQVLGKIEGKEGLSLPLWNENV